MSRGANPEPRQPKAKAAQTPLPPPATPHLSHLVGRLRHSVPVHVWSVYQEVDQRPTFGYPSHAGFWSIAEVDERGISDGWTFSFRSNGKLIQFDIHKNSLDKNTRYKGYSSIFLSTILGRHGLSLSQVANGLENWGRRAGMGPWCGELAVVCGH